MGMVKFYDISRPLFSQMPLYPGNPGVSLQFVQRRPKHSTNLSQLSLGSHSGTHVDAPKHVIFSKTSADQLPLELFYGPCRVLDFSKTRGSISLSQVQSASVKKGERLLFKTSNSVRLSRKFRPDFVFLSIPAARFLASKKVALIGVDGPSVQQFHSGNQDGHEALLLHGIPILEGLDLSKVPAGRYTLAAFPLRVQGAEAAPLRAVLIRN